MVSEHTSVRLGEVADAIPNEVSVSEETRRYFRRKYVEEGVKTVRAEDVDKMDDALGELHDALETINSASSDAIDAIQELRDVRENATLDGESDADATIDEAIKPLATIDATNRTEDNPAIINKAQTLGIDPSDVLAELEDRYPTDRLGKAPVESYQTENGVTQ